MAGAGGQQDCHTHCPGQKTHWEPMARQDPIPLPAWPHSASQPCFCSVLLPSTLLLQGKGSLPMKGRVAAEQRCRAKDKGQDSQG